jgi:hypothetical protein
MASILSIRNSMESQIKLLFHNCIDGLIFNCYELFLVPFLLIYKVFLIKQRLGSKKTSQVLRPERRTLAVLYRHVPRRADAKNFYKIAIGIR